MERLIVGMSGASGAILGIRLLEVLSPSDYEIHLVLSDAAKKTIRTETDWKVEDVEALADHVHDFQDVGAPISSGSFKTRGMIIIPCSIKTLSAVAYSFNTNLLVRAADVVLKERRKLVLVPRETPVHSGQLELMLKVTVLGAQVVLPVLTFYHRPKTIEDMVNHLVGKVLDTFGIDHDLFERWGSSNKKHSR